MSDAQPTDTTAPQGEAKGEAEFKPGKGYWSLVWLQFRKNTLAMLSAVVIVGLVALAAWAPLLALGLPFSWTKLDPQSGQLVTTYPLWQYMVAPDRGVDYLFNYIFFLTITVPGVMVPVWWFARGRNLHPRILQRRALLGGAGALLLAALPFIKPGAYERSATPAEREARPGTTTVTEWHILRRWVNDPVDYVREKTNLDASKGEGAWFPIVPYHPTGTSIDILKHPSSEHLLGTDSQGRDVMARMLHGGRISMSVGFVSVSISVLVGIFIGGLAGYYRGWVDMLISRLIEIVICFPAFFLILTIIAFIEDRSIFHVMLVIGFTSWPGVARLIRGEFLKLADQDFVHAARALGCGGSRIMFRHILPNALGPVLVSAAFGVAGAVLTESGLSYLGFGAPPPTPTWGELISQGKAHVDEAGYLLFFPGFMIFLTVTVYNLAGDGLRDAMDPRMRH